MTSDQAEQPMWQEPQAPPDAACSAGRRARPCGSSSTSLPAPFREAIVLREFNDMSYREIAEVAGVPVGTVMSRLARGRALLLAGMEGEGRRCAIWFATPATAEASGSAEGRKPQFIGCG